MSRATRSSRIQVFDVPRDELMRAQDCGSTGGPASRVEYAGTQSSRGSRGRRRDGLFGARFVKKPNEFRFPDRVFTAYKKGPGAELYFSCRVRSKPRVNPPMVSALGWFRNCARVPARCETVV